jgi:metal-responsive CopG/Arc/MetJ family transcriptional regulator
VTETFLEDIDAAWQEEGNNSRSEFIRESLRDAVRHPGLTRESWTEIQPSNTLVGPAISRRSPATR